MRKKIYTLVNQSHIRKLSISNTVARFNELKKI